MGYCKHCGNDVTGVKFCAKCGSAVEETIVQPVQTMQAGQQVQEVPVGNVGKLPSDGMGIAGFICGLLGLVACCGITSIPGLICSLISMNKVKKGLVDPSTKWMGVTGMILSIIGIVLLLVVVIYYIFIVWYALEIDTYA